MGDMKLNFDRERGFRLGSISNRGVDEVQGTPSSQGGVLWTFAKLLNILSQQNLVLMSNFILHTYLFAKLPP